MNDHHETFALKTRITMFDAAENANNYYYVRFLHRLCLHIHTFYYNRRPTEFLNINNAHRNHFETNTIELGNHGRWTPISFVRLQLRKKHVPESQGLVPCASDDGLPIWRHREVQNLTWSEKQQNQQRMSTSMLFPIMLTYTITE